MADEDMNDIQAVLNGCEDAYKKLVMRYEAQISRMMWYFAQNQADCEQLVQDVFVEVFFSLKNFKGHAPFIVWLKKIATRTGYRFWKQKSKRRNTYSLQDYDYEINGDLSKIDATEAAEILYALLAQLPDSDRLVLTLMYFDDCSVKEIASRMGWTHGAAKMRLMRARNKMKKIAEKEKIWEKLGWIH